MFSPLRGFVTMRASSRNAALCLLFGRGFAIINPAIPAWVAAPRRALLGSSAAALIAVAPAFAGTVTFDLPDMPSFSVPSLSIPSFSVPSLSMPSLSLPSVSLPSSVNPFPGDQSQLAEQKARAADEAAHAKQAANELAEVASPSSPPSVDPFADEFVPQLPDRQATAIAEALPAAEAPSAAEAPPPKQPPAAEASRVAWPVEKQAALRRVRAERMAAEAHAQSEEYQKVMANVGTQSFGSTTTVR